LNGNATTYVVNLPDGDCPAVYGLMISRIPSLAEKFLVAGSDYGEAFRELGLRGQYSDMHRKMAKLKRAIWDGQPLARESVEEVLGDLFGHILIALYLIAEDK
jgi:hypothetical protein